MRCLGTPEFLGWLDSTAYTLIANVRQKYGPDCVITSVAVHPQPRDIGQLDVLVETAGGETAYSVPTLGVAHEQLEDLAEEIILRRNDA